MLAPGLVAAGWDVHVLTMAPGGRYWNEMSATKGVTLQSLDRNGRFDFSVVSKCVDYIARHDIDVVHGWMQPCNTFAALAGVRARRPVVLSVRNVADGIVGFGSRLYMRSEPWLARWSRAVVVSNSKAAMDEWLAHGLPQERLRHIPNGLWPPPRALAAPFAHGEAPRIGMLARLDPIKGHAVVLRALARIVSDGLDVRFVSYGRGTPLQLSRLQSLARELGVAGRAEFRPASASPWDALESIDLFVSASGAEGMSNSLMEAMAAGRVIVATDVGDARAMLTGPGGPSGFLTTPDEAGITDAIRLALANRELAIARAEAARRAAASFSPSAMVASYERVYAGLLHRASTGA